jgi:hypothetical protein
VRGRFRFDFQEKTLNVDVHFPEVTKNCKYQLNGKVMLLPVVGEGESTLVLSEWGQACGAVPFAVVSFRGCKNQRVPRL